MDYKLWYEKGNSLNESFYIGSDGKSEDVVVRASYVTKPETAEAIAKIAADEEMTEEQKVAELEALPEQPEAVIEAIQSECSDLEAFRAFAIDAASEKMLEVQAEVKVDDEPQSATEPLEKVKVDAEPVCAAEEPYASGTKPEMTTSNEVKSLLARLSTKVAGDPTQAIDVNSALQLLAEELEKAETKVKDVEKKLSDREKDDDLKEIFAKLTALGIMKDPKAKDKYSKSFEGLDDKAIGVFEEVLEDILAAHKDKAPAAAKPAGNPFPPKNEAKMPPISASQNVVQEPLTPDPVHPSFGGGPENKLTEAWGIKDSTKALFASR